MSLYTDDAFETMLRASAFGPSFLELLVLAVDL